ncbi:demethoxyubiquinone hydroxylase family protein [Desulfosporosinus meridiei]|uniref:Ubiquinone biosynthesis protein COQ7 n=1 Tax=Desulfosporosinus meridiei (strain ATCC BAA-275 / DSM 13257 / KCTC 12902 / NCIMB 13706 / S10) TaxID=768704 RepID=J7ISU7_DESMD|nr:ferritin-like domain-containing protein [Desulfosporosinus meridiei]AFQ43254.1 ubiquinone biosynthesis protein COQ7 [Desulfosporosinus meridiei DSM 13257]
MDDKLIFRLKEFYTLETFQVAFYESQVSSSTNEYYKKAFKKMVEIESGHADFFAQVLTKADIEVPTIIGSAFELAGGFLGDMVSLTGSDNTCKLGIALENKAMEAYRTFIDESKDKHYSELRNTLMDYLLDEEFHTLWLRDYMENHPQ